MWTCLYGFVLDILCVKHIICTLNCDMCNMSKISIFSIIPSQNKIFRFTNSEFRPLDTKFRPKSPKFRRYTSEFRFLNSNSLSIQKQRNSVKFRSKFRFRQLPGFHRKTKWLTLAGSGQDDPLRFDAFLKFEEFFQKKEENSASFASGPQKI